jgi:hypothetical protein
LNTSRKGGFFVGKEVKTMKEKYTPIEPFKQENGRYLVDFTQPGSPLLSGLKEPVRKIRYGVAAIDYVFPRGADDPTPDYVVEVGGLYYNMNDGRVGKTIDEVK